MKETVLGKTGIKVKRIGFGGIPIQRLDNRESDLVLEKAIDAGINFFDTARGYTTSEAKMGRILPRYRENIFIATKSFARSAQEMSMDIEWSLKDLNTDYIDLYQCHNISSEDQLYQVTSEGGALRALQKAKEEGKIRHIGITGHKPFIVIKALEHFETIQVPFNIVENAACDELIPAAKERDLGIIGMKPIGGGMIGQPKLNFRFMFESGIDVAIPGMDSEQQVVDNFSVLGEIKLLSPEEMNLLLEEKERLGETFCRRCEYCMLCPEGLNIPFLHLLKNYYFRYNLKDWALERLAALPKTYEDCTKCGECISKCPYELDTPAIFQETLEKMLLSQE